MAPGTPTRRNNRGLATLLIAGAVLVALELIPIADEQTTELVSDACLAIAGLLSAGVILLRARQAGAWGGMRAFGLAMLVLGVAKTVEFIIDLGDDLNDADNVDLLFLLIGALFLIPARVQFRDHFRSEDRREISADVALISVALISVVYLLIRPTGVNQELAAFVWSALFAITAAAAITSFIALTLWVPSPSHFGQLAVVGVFTGASLTVGTLWVRGTAAWGFAGLDIPLIVASLFLAGLMLVRPDDPPHLVTSAGWGRPVLTTISVGAAAGSLGVVAALQVNGSATTEEGAALIALLAAAIAGRILINQVRSTQAKESTERALEERESALMETDRAIARLQDAMSTLANSEERFRLLFDAAVDGIVELAGNDLVRQVNGAFCDMVGLERDAVIGHTWAEVARASRGGDSIASLLTTGQATLDREGHEVFLEARTSSIPGLPPGRLLLVRDVTSAKVADQTIRSLFKFLQDRDEDRTRLLKRTNAAIEAERNRIARDLHDGPVQGVSAASLSLEAVLLMLEGGDVDRAKATLVKVRGHLSEEADNLRHLMSNLRPPLLEERGLVPALQETLARYGREHQVRTRFRSRALVEVPTDLETLAYRLVQEALTNANKHADATEVSVTADAVAGQLRIEITDDGKGFDPGKARDFLRVGKVGLASMRERIELANGTFMVRSSPGAGTTIVATLPLESVPSQRELASN